MAQRAFVPYFLRIEGTQNVNEMRIVFPVYLLEESVNSPFSEELTITTAWTDTAGQIKSKVVAAILALAAANNYSTLTASNVFLPQYAKG